MRRLVIPSGLALVLLCLMTSLLAGGPRPALAARVPASAFPAPTGAYTTYLPLVMRDFALEVYPNDPYFGAQWGLEVVEAPRAWGITRGSPSVLIAVVDSGTDLDHPDLADKVRTDIDWDFVNDDDVADDDHGHGTHVSGIAAAATDNGVGVAGLGWETMILPLKALDQIGNGWSTDIAEAIYYAADNGAHVINMSLGGDAPCPWYMQNAADEAYANGVILVAAAGNHGEDVPNAEYFPANCEHVLGVAATNPDDSVASYSNYGSHVSIAAPGSSIYSTLMGGSYGYMRGTSMATPHVAGLAALLRARYPSYTPDQIASAILDNAEDLGEAGWDEHYGCGRINASLALSVGAHGSSPVCLEGVGTWSVGAAAEVQEPTAAPFVPGELIVSFRPGIKAARVAQRHGASAEFLPTLRAWRLRVPPGQEMTLLARLRADPAVAYADLNYLVVAR